MKDSVTIHAIVAHGRNEGRKVGRAEGRKEGRKEGREEGREEDKLQEARELLFRLGRTRFGRPSDSNIKTIERITDRVRLEELFLRLNDAKSWRELLAMPPAGDSGN
jgi:predicted transposase YdaD